MKLECEGSRMFALCSKYCFIEQLEAEKRSSARRVRQRRRASTPRSKAAMAWQKGEVDWREDGHVRAEEERT